MRVLIAEDDVTSRRILEGLLPKWGYALESFARGDEAFARLKQAGAPRIAILDRAMPGMEGAEICRAIRSVETTEPPYLILLTVQGEARSVIEGLESGASDYIVKPYDFGELRARLQVGRRVVELQEALGRQVRELQEALRHIKVLQGLLPICMYCHRIRTDPRSWQRLEGYLSDHADVTFTHGICPDCFDKQQDEFKKVGLTP